MRLPWVVGDNASVVALSDRLRGAGVTQREAEVLESLGARLTNAEIAENLYLSVRTVESHVSSLLRKLGADDRRSLSALARETLASPHEQPPLPTPLSDLIARDLFVGREAQLDVLGRDLDDARQSKRRHIVLVTGEAGIGKSRLVAEFAVSAHAQGVAICFGRCEEEALAPYQPFIDAVEGLLPHVPTAVAKRAAPALAPLLPRLLPPPELAAVPSASDEPGLARHRVFEAFDAVLSGVPMTLMVVVDDLHWADRSTLLLLRHLLRHSDRSTMLVAATARREGMDPGSGLGDLLAEVERDQEVPELRLDGLRVEHIAELVEGRSAAQAVAQDTWIRTGGNPFLVHQLLRHFDESGEMPGHAKLPQQVRDIVTRRLARLDPGLVEILTAGAVSGEAFRLGVAARALRKEPERLLDMVQTAVAAGVVTEVPGRPDSYRFTHALVRDALEQHLTTSRRAHLHVRLAEQLERLGAEHHLAEIAHHRHSGLPEGEPARATSACRRAAAQALELLAYERAAEFCTMALDAVDAGGGNDTDRLEALLARGDARLRAGDAEGGRGDFLAAGGLARHVGDAPRWGLAALGVGETSAIWGDDPELITNLEGALAALSDRELALRARVRARLAQALYYSAPAERRAMLSDAAVGEARDSGDPAALAWVLSARHVARWGPGDLEARIVTAEEIVRLARELGDDKLELLGLGWLVVDRLERGDVAGCDDAHARHGELAARLRQLSHRRDSEMWAAMRAMLAGQLDEAGESIERARDLGEAAHDPNAETIWWIQRYWLGCEREEAAALEELVAPYEALTARYPQAPAWRAALAMLHSRLGDATAARKVFDQLKPDGFAGLPRDVVYVNALTYLAEACHFLGDAGAARTLLGLLEPFTGRVAIIDRALACKGSIDRHLGLLAATAGDRDMATNRLRAALAQHEQMGAVLLAARTRRELERLAMGRVR
jgi:DNA-binding CsgD family transcriptional regulator